MSDIPRGPTAAEIAMLDLDRSVRLAAVEQIPPDRAGLYVLRQVLLHDSDAATRAAAAARMGQHPDGPGVRPWLCQALQDAFPSVREAAYLALARAGDSSTMDVVSQGCLADSTWWVRRSAVRALTAAALRDPTQHLEVVGVLRRALADPFWRVRNIVVQGLGRLGDTEPRLRVEILDPLDGDEWDPPTRAVSCCARRSALQGGSAALHAAAGSALTYLAAHWNPDSAPPVPPSTHVPRSGVGLDNDDPAVVTAHLEALDAPALDPMDLVPLLGTSHAALRGVVCRRLAESRHAGALAAALGWLDHPGVPHAVSTVRQLLGRVDAPLAEELAHHTLLDHERPGAVCWALEYLGQLADLDRMEALVQHRDPAVRRTAAEVLGLLAVGEKDRSLQDGAGREVRWLLTALRDEDPSVREAAVESLVDLTPYPEVRRALATLDCAGQTAPARCLLMQAVARHRVSGLDDPHPSVRATALRELALAGELDADRRAAALLDSDPWVRGAVMDVEAAPALLQDPNPWIARMAARQLVGASRQMATHRRLELARHTASSTDPWVQACGCRMLDLTLDDEAQSALRLVLPLSHDRRPMVRAAAAEVLEQCSTLQARLLVLLQSTDLPPATRSAAYTWLLRGTDERAREQVSHTLQRLEQEPSEVQQHVRAMALMHEGLVQLLDDEQPRVEPAPRRSPPRLLRREVPQRRLGQTALELSPLAISGVNRLSVEALEQAYQAGVNLFFWEPRYYEMTRFLRRLAQSSDVLVVAGTFHAHRAGIEHDLELALRRLRRRRIDLFLLFWARSAERLGPEPYDVLRRLQRQGLVRAVGFSTHHRELACEAVTRREWDAMMIRHNAAHRGAERGLFEAARAQGTGVLTFSSLCYGRMLQRMGPATPPSAVDCYRYSLAQPGVAACISAPRRYRELQHNLQVLEQPALSPAEVAALRAHGDAVYAEDHRFDALLRQPARPTAGSTAAENAYDVTSDLPPASVELTEDVDATLDEWWRG